MFIVKSHKSPRYRYLQRDSHSFLGQFQLVTVRNYRRKASPYPCPYLCQQMDQNWSHLPTFGRPLCLERTLGEQDSPINTRRHKRLQDTWHATISSLFPTNRVR